MVGSTSLGAEVVKDGHTARREVPGDPGSGFLASGPLHLSSGLRTPLVPSRRQVGPYRKTNKHSGGVPPSG